MDSFVITHGEFDRRVIHEHLPDAQTIPLPGCGPHTHLHVELAHVNLSMGSVREGALIAIGPEEVPAGSLERILVGARSVQNIDHYSSRLSGQYWVIAVVDGRLRVQGTASGLHRVFHARLGNTTVVSNRARLIADLGELSIDPTSVAMRLLQPLQHPFPDISCWTGVASVPPHSYLSLSETSSPHIHRWWHSPDAQTSIDDGALSVAAATIEVLDIHLAGRSVATCEISGGLDSAAITATLDHRNRRGDSSVALHGLTSVSRDEFNSDVGWAQELTSHLSLDSHTFLQPEQLPLEYDDLAAAAAYRLDEPSIAISSHSRLNTVTDLARGLNSQVHFTGYGGDQVFIPNAALCRDLFASSPMRALALLRAYRSMYRWKRTAAVQQFMRPGPYRSWIQQRYLSSESRNFHAAMMTWGAQGILPGWMSDEARESILTRVHDHPEIDSLERTPGKHMELSSIYEISGVVRGLSDIAATHSGLPVVAPLLDDRLIDAALAVRIEDRMNPYQYKPLLSASFKDILPSSVQRRTTKGAHNTDKAYGLLRNAKAIREYMADSLLVDVGIVDPQKLQPLLQQPDTPLFDNNDLAMTVACEAWLRSLTTAGNAGTSRLSA
ncbi:MAG: asparagine synthase-related protein [Rhodococcus sp. (in: high G+C Gram-positive bacteria)]